MITRVDAYSGVLLMIASFDGQDSNAAEFSSFLYKEPMPSDENPADTGGADGEPLCQVLAWTVRPQLHQCQQESEQCVSPSHFTFLIQLLHVHRGEIGAGKVTRETRPGTVLA